MVDGNYGGIDIFNQCPSAHQGGKIGLPIFEVDS